MPHKIGVGVITCNAEHRLRLSLPLIPNVDNVVVVNDGLPYSNDVYPKGMEVIQHSRNKGVGIAKNDAMRYLVQQNCDSIFLIEDDILIKNENVFEQYIKTAEATGVWHLNYALQGPANRKQQVQGPMNIDKRGELSSTSEPNPRQIVEYKDGIELALYPNCVGAFTYFLKNIIKTVGYHDERFKNAWEHCELTYKIIKAKLHPEWWWFADIANSWEYIDSIPGCIEDSTIAKTPEWHKNFREGAEWFNHKHGYYTTTIPDTPPQQVLETLKFLETNYSRKIL